MKQTIYNAITASSFIWAWYFAIAPTKLLNPLSKWILKKKQISFFHKPLTECEGCLSIQVGLLMALYHLNICYIGLVCLFTCSIFKYLNISIKIKFENTLQTFKNN